MTCEIIFFPTVCLLEESGHLYRLFSCQESLLHSGRDLIPDLKMTSRRISDQLLGYRGTRNTCAKMDCLDAISFISPLPGLQQWRG